MRRGELRDAHQHCLAILKVDPTFADAAFSQVVGEVGPPVKTPYGYHLIKVTEHHLPEPPTLENSRDKIIMVLKKSRGAKLVESWVSELREKAEIVMNVH